MTRRMRARVRARDASAILAWASRLGRAESSSMISFATCFDARWPPWCDWNSWVICSYTSGSSTVALLTRPKNETIISKSVGGMAGVTAGPSSAVSAIFSGCGRARAA